RPFGAARRRGGTRYGNRRSRCAVAGRRSGARAASMLPGRDGRGIRGALSAAGETGGVIGYYVHHHGRGHLSRATAIAAALETEVTVLSSLTAPADWSGPWIELPRDDEDHGRSPDANGRLHWAPIHSNGLRERMSAISRWIG